MELRDYSLPMTLFPKAYPNTLLTTSGLMLPIKMRPEPMVMADVLTLLHC